MRFLIGIFVFFGAIFAAENDDALIEIVSDFRKNGMGSAAQKIEEILMTPAYWEKILAHNDNDFGYYESMKFLFVSNKLIPMLWLYKIENGALVEMKRVSSVVGIGGGAKRASGDKITPIGVYNFVTKLQKLHKYYGAAAFTTNYPNLYDRVNARTGYGIWIHGLPLDGMEREKNTRGCIAIDNDVLKEFDRIIELDKTVLISYDKSAPKVEATDLAKILAALYQWKHAWTHSDAQKYLAFYDKNFKKIDEKSRKITGIKEFAAYKKRIFAKNEKKEIKFSDINISPYPNDERKKLFVVAFLQQYTAFHGAAISYQSRGKKELYVAIDGEKISILAEK